MRCIECGSAMKSRRENHHYVECGLKHVTLVGVEVRRCTRCGSHEVALPRVETLHRLIARALIEKTTRFTGDEIRYLRKSLGWSGTDFARHMGVAETVSRWENGAIPIGPQADRLLRLLVAQGKPTMRYPTERLSTIDARRATATRLEVGARNERWELLAS
jgi:putative zinc finger/helix-turn-helix YgiT family protein